jgi:hypothetical protein
VVDGSEAALGFLLVALWRTAIVPWSDETDDALMTDWWSV